MARTEDGRTALHTAALGCHREVCAVLLARTGLPLTGHNAGDLQGETPLDLCPASFREELRELFAASEAAGDERGAVLHRRVLSSAAPLVAGRYAQHTSVGKRVVLAQDVMRHRPVALKFFPTQESLEREASLLNIVGPETCPEVYDMLLDGSGESHKQHVLVMQPADPNYSTPSSCSELAHFCQRRRKGLEARTHALRLAQCVLALHDRNLVHTDLKVEHFLRFSGEWKLVDLGTVVEDGVECLPPCTVRYAPPEVAAARIEQTPLRVTAAVDVWALGVVLYELFAGKPLLREEQLTLASIASDPKVLYTQRLESDRALTEPERRLLLNLLHMDPELRGRDPALSTAGSAVVGSAVGRSAGGGGSASAASPRSAMPALREMLGRSFFAMGEDTEEAKQIEVLALFSSPRRFRTGQPITPLQLMREVANVQEAIPRRLREIRPAARFPDDIKAAISQSSPRVIQFSGHGLVGRDGSRRLAFEIEDGTIALPDPAMFVELLRLMPRLECVFLNACLTLAPGPNGEKSLGERIVEVLPHLTVVGWKTITEDKAAAAFSRGFYDALGRGLGGSGGKVSIAEAFASGEELFLRLGYKRGDPAGPLGRAVHGDYGKMAVKRERHFIAYHQQLHLGGGKMLEKRLSADDAVRTPAPRSALPSRHRRIGSTGTNPVHERPALRDAPAGPAAVV